MTGKYEAVVATTADRPDPQAPDGLVTRTNELLRSARRARRSPSGSGRVLSRQEVADGCNQILEAGYANAGHTRRWAGMTATYIGALERGEVRWPNQDYRAALGVFFNATTVDLGFYIDRPERLPDSWTGSLAASNEVPVSQGRACMHCAAPSDLPALAAP